MRKRHAGVASAHLCLLGGEARLLEGKDEALHASRFRERRRGVIWSDRAATIARSTSSRRNRAANDKREFIGVRRDRNHMVMHESAIGAYIAAEEATRVDFPAFERLCAEWHAYASKCHMRCSPGLRNGEG